MSSSSEYYCFIRSLLKHCRQIPDLIVTKQLHCHILKTVKYPDPFLHNNLIGSYGELGNIVYARHVFDKMPQRDLFSWNSILSAYSKLGYVAEMRVIFDQMPNPDGVSWNSLILGYANYGSACETVEAYSLMLRFGVGELNMITFSTMLLLPLNIRCVDIGRQIHGQIVKFGFLNYVFVGSPLLNMYVKMGLVNEAKQIFEELPERNVWMYNTMIFGFMRCGRVTVSKDLFYSMREKNPISWSTMITGFVENNLEREAIDLFREMRLQGLAMNEYTFGSVLTACSGIKALEQGKQIHGFIIRSVYDDNIFVGSALIDMYCKCKSVRYGETIFRRMRHKNVVSWTAMLVGYGQNGLSEEAVRSFRYMKRSGIQPNEFTVASVISSCANLASLEEGAQFHGQALSSGLMSHITVSNALVTLYGKCGNLEDSNQLFNEMSFKNEVSWSALISIYAQFGKANDTIELFEKMLAHGLKPDGITFTGVLSACSRAGLVERGKIYFESMIKEHRITPVLDHYNCMIDLFSRTGRLKEARNFINEMPFRPDIIGWFSLLSSCRFYNNLEIGRWAAESLLHLDPQNYAAYVLLSSIYAAKGDWNEVGWLRKGMRKIGAKKEPGCSWINYKGKVHVFRADDRSSQFSDLIIAELEKLNEKMIKEGYVPDSSSVLYDVEESEKTKKLNYHSERLAIVFGLLFIARGFPIRVFKNLRVCGDCHTATKYISKITQREILVRDAVRFHLFRDGKCSCGDFW